MKDKPPDLARFLPDMLAGWEIIQEDQWFDRANLYDYIDGGAELYLSYGFRRALSRTFTRPDQPDIIVDLFDMGESRNAFGVFSHSRESIETDYGQGSQFYSGFLTFWRGRYLISILASPPTDKADAALRELAARIAASIAEDGPLPDILALLPVQGLVEESVRYFRHHVWLNSYYYLAEDNILHINDSTDAVLAGYGPPEERHFLLVIQYPFVADAETAQESFLERYLPEGRSRPAVQLEDGGWTASHRAGAVVGVVFKAPSEQAALGLLEAVAQGVDSLQR